MAYYRTKTDTVMASAAITSGLIGLLVIVSTLVGWIMNIVWLFNHLGTSDVTIGVVLRCIGVVFGPLGAIMGYWG